MVPMLTCGLVRWNLAFATGLSPRCDWSPLPVGFWRSALAPVLNSCSDCSTTRLLASCLGDDLLRDVRRDFGVRIELHAVVRSALGTAAQVTHVAEHLRQRHVGG